MLGKAKDIQTVSFETYYSPYSDSEPISKQINDWLSHNSWANIIDIKYATYSMTNADGDLSFGERALLIHETQ
ncbi:hypothetical protein ACEU2D_17865 [Brevibacillus laterosporus]|uniref:hypothetical protein n=1 Tax=Brevibacillus laterosporus TaxID=1465 RepID=UPI0035A6DF6D